MQVEEKGLDIDVHGLYVDMCNNNIVLMYQGYFDQGIVKSVLSMAEKKLVQENVSEVVRKKLFNILVEALQNICKHTSESDGINNTPFLVIARTSENYTVATGNLIQNSAIAIVTEKIEFVNSLSAADLKEYYKTARIKSVISDVGGAGLGFIDMVRKSGNKISFKFYPIDKDRSFFVLSNLINNN